MNVRVGLVAVGALVLALSGCGEDEPSADPAADSSSAGATTSAGAGAATGAGDASGDATDAGGPSGSTDSSPSAGSDPTGSESASTLPPLEDPSSDASEGAAQEEPLVTGKILAVRDQAARVKSAGTTYIVRWAPDATVVVVASAGRGDVQVGACVIARPGDGSTAPRPAFTADVVRILEPDGSCGQESAGGGSGGGATGSEGGASGGGDGAGDSETVTADGGAVVGAVVEITADGFVISPNTGALRRVEVSVDGSTRYLEGAPGAAQRPELQKGQCLAAYGQPQSGQVLVATRVRVSPPIGRSCAGTS